MKNKSQSKLPECNFSDEEKPLGYCWGCSVAGGDVAKLCSVASLSKPLMTW